MEILEDIYSTEGLVKEVLENFPDTRSSDSLLYVKICKMINPKIARMPYERVMLEADKLGIPRYDSVSRCRRKVQAEYKELRGDKKTTGYRFLRWKVFREYATDK